MVTQARFSTPQIARPAREPPTPAQRPLVGSEPMSAIANLPSPLAPPPLLAPHSVSSRPKKISLTPILNEEYLPKTPGGSFIQRLQHSPLEADRDVHSNLSNGSWTSTVRPPVCSRSLIRNAPIPINPNGPVSLDVDRPRRLSDEATVLPNSLSKDHFDRSRAPSVSVPRSINTSTIGQATVRPESLARHMREYQFILRELDSAPTESSLGTVKASKVEEVGVDELEVEWCVLCGRAKEREKMELKEVAKPGEVGVWWVCKEGCADARTSGLS